MRSALLALCMIGGLAALAGENGHKFTKDHPAVKLTPGHWLEVPDSHLRKVAFKWPGKGVGHEIGTGSIRNIMTAWCGGAYDTRRERLIIWGGGHKGYAGNEIYVFDVPKLKWERINDPSLVLDSEKGETYKDGKPRSVHTYDYIEYIPSIDRFVSLGIYATYPSGVGGGNTTWWFDFQKKKWEAKSARPVPLGGKESICGSVFDPVTGHEFMHTRGGHIWEYDPQADKWKRLVRGISGRYGTVGALDPIGRRYLAIGKGLGGIPKDFYGADISGRETPKRQTIIPKGPNDILKTPHPGLDYDPVLDKIIGWGGGADLFALDLELMTWKKMAPAATNKVTPTAALRQGTYGRFRYIPSLNAYIVVNAVDQNVYIGRLTDRTKQPIPKRFVTVLKTSKDAKLIKYVAGQVALWPKDKAEPLLKACLAAQKSGGNAGVAKFLEETVKKLGK